MNDLAPRPERSPVSRLPQPKDASPKELLPRHDLATERQVLGAIMLAPEESLALAQMHLRPSDFYYPAHAVIFEAMLAVAARTEPIDVVTMCAELRGRERLNTVGGMQYLGELTDCVATFRNIEKHAKIVSADAQVRRLATIGAEIVAATHDPSLNATEIQERASDAIARAVVARGDDECVDLATEIMALWDELATEVDPTPPRPMGLVDLDSLCAGGLLPGKLVVIAARPSMGKTSLALQIACSMSIRSRRPALVFSMEMTRRELLLRLLGAKADVDGNAIQSRALVGEQWDHVSAAGADLSSAPLIICERKELSFADVRGFALQQTAKRGPLECVVIDYLQLMAVRESKENRSRQIGEITRGLKVLAGQLGCPVILLSQLNRDLEKRPNKRPQLADLRESGDIEQDADLVLFIYRDEVYDKQSSDKGVAEIIVGKQRRAATGTARVAFRGERTSFANLEEDRREPPAFVPRSKHKKKHYTPEHHDE